MDMVTEIKDGVVDGTPGGIQQQIQVCDSGLHEWKDTEELGAREKNRCRCRWNSSRRYSIADSSM